MRVNYLAVAVGTLAVLRGMRARGAGVVVNVSSDVARAPEPGEAAYAASKAAIAAFTESISHEVAADGAVVHVLYPAWVPTAMGMSGITERIDVPPKLVRRTEEQVSALLLERIGRERLEINAAALPLIAPIANDRASRLSALNSEALRCRAVLVRAIVLDSAAPEHHDDENDQQNEDNGSDSDIHESTLVSWPMRAWIVALTHTRTGSAGTIPNSGVWISENKHRRVCSCTSMTRRCSADQRAPAPFAAPEGGLTTVEPRLEVRHR
jgi:hypothetical protein